MWGEEVCHKQALMTHQAKSKEVWGGVGERRYVWMYRVGGCVWGGGVGYKGRKEVKEALPL